MTVILETQRLILREFENQEADIEGLKSFLQDEEVMWAYEHRFSDEEVTDWIKGKIFRNRLSFAERLLASRICD